MIFFFFLLQSFPLWHAAFNRQQSKWPLKFRQKWSRIQCNKRIKLRKRLEWDFNAISVVAELRRCCNENSDVVNNVMMQQICKICAVEIHAACIKLGKYLPLALGQRLSMERGPRSPLFSSEISDD